MPLSSYPTLVTLGFRPRPSRKFRDPADTSLRTPDAEAQSTSSQQVIIPYHYQASLDRHILPFSTEPLTIITEIPCQLSLAHHGGLGTFLSTVQGLGSTGLYPAMHQPSAHSLVVSRSIHLGAWMYLGIGTDLMGWKVCGCGVDCGSSG